MITFSTAVNVAIAAAVLVFIAECVVLGLNRYRQGKRVFKHAASLSRSFNPIGAALTQAQLNASRLGRASAQLIEKSRQIRKLL